MQSDDLFDLTLSAIAVGVAVPELLPISVFVKLGYWEEYRLNVVLTARLFCKLLYIWGFVALLWLGLSVLLLFRPAPEQEWAIWSQNGSPLKWLFALPVIFCSFCPWVLPDES